MCAKTISEYMFNHAEDKDEGSEVGQERSSLFRKISF